MNLLALAECSCSASTTITITVAVLPAKTRCGRVDVVVDHAALSWQNGSTDCIAILYRSRRGLVPQLIT